MCPPVDPTIAWGSDDCMSWLQSLLISISLGKSGEEKYPIGVLGHVANFGQGGRICYRIEK